MPKVLILIAMDKEGKDFAEKSGFTPSDISLIIPEVPAEVYEKRVSDTDSQFLVISGKCPLHGVNRIGPSMNLVGLTAIASIKPDYVINPGFAGGFVGRGADIGDVYLGEGPVFSHDRHFTEGDTYKRYCEGGFPVYVSDDLTVALGAKRGRITSSGSMLASEEERANMERFETVVKDMETLALAEVAFLMRTRFVPLKVITDRVDVAPCSQAEFEENYPRLVDRLHEATQIAADFLMTYSPEASAGTESGAFYGGATEDAKPASTLEKDS